jgi:hypothetical protein
MNLTISIPDEKAPEFASLVAAAMIEAGAEMKAPEREEPFTVPEAAKAIGLGERTINREIAAGLWPLVPRTGRNLIPVWAVRARQRGEDPAAILRKGKGRVSR